MPFSLTHANPESETEMYLFDPHKKCIQSNNEIVTRPFPCNPVTLRSSRSLRATNNGEMEPSTQARKAQTCFLHLRMQYVSQKSFDMDDSVRGRLLVRHSLIDGGLAKTVFGLNER